MALVYHRVGATATQDFLDRGGVPRISPAALRGELEFLLGLGARILTFRDLREGEFPAASEIGVVVTFDDGFRDSYEQGLPIVESLGGRAVVFQCSAMLSAAGGLPEHRLYRLLFGSPEGITLNNARLLARAILPEPSPTATPVALVRKALTEISYKTLQGVLDQLGPEPSPELMGLYPDRDLLRNAASAGHEIGSHGHRHLHRSTLEDAQFEEELRLSFESLDAVLGRPPAAFSYPFGAIAKGDTERCRKYFRQAATCDREHITASSPPMALGRFSWPGIAPNRLRRQRWLLTGRV